MSYNNDGEMREDFREVFVRRGGLWWLRSRLLMLNLIEQFCNLIVLLLCEIAGEDAPPPGVALDGTRRLCQLKKVGREGKALPNI